MVVVAFPERKWQWLRERVCLVRENARGQSGGSQKREREEKNVQKMINFQKEQKHRQTSSSLMSVLFLW